MNKDDILIWDICRVLNSASDYVKLAVFNALKDAKPIGEEE